MIKQTILKGVLHGVGFILTIGVFIIGYAAWVNISNVTTSDTLTATGWNNVINNLNDLNTRITNNFSNVDNTADVNKNVLSATKLTTPRTINGISFDGTANIIIPTGGDFKTTLNEAANYFYSKFGLWGTAYSPFTIHLTNTNSSCGGTPSYPAYPSCPTDYISMGTRQSNYASGTCSDGEFSYSINYRTSQRYCKLAIPQ